MHFQRSKSTLDRLKSVFNVFRRKSSLGAPSSRKNTQRNQLLEPEGFVNFSTVKMICRTLKQTDEMNGRKFYIFEAFVWNV